MHYHYFFYTLLGWPSGIILGNLLASIVWSALFEWRLRAHTKRTTDHIAALTKRLEDQTKHGIRVWEEERRSYLLRHREQEKDSRPEIGE